MHPRYDCGRDILHYAIYSLIMECKTPTAQISCNFNRPSKQTMTAMLKVMDSHLFAPNKRNTLALATPLRLPNFHLVGIELKVLKTADRYFNDFRACDGHSWAKRS